MTDPPLIFVHIPKTAGMSMLVLLNTAFGQEQVLKLYQREEFAAFDQVLARGDPVQCVAGHRPYGLHERLNTPCRYISVVREPVSRYISLYRYLVGRPEHGQHKAAASMGPDEFFPWLVENVRGEGPNAQCRYLLGRQCREFSDVRRAIDENYWLIGHVERMEDFAETLTRRMGWKPMRLPQNNQAPTEPIGLKAATVEAILKAHALDHEAWTYVKQVFDERAEAAAR